MTIPIAYWMLSGAVAAHRAQEIVATLSQYCDRILTVPTPNSARVISPRELARIPGHRLVESYFDQALTPRAPLAPVLWMPCSFNSLNKLAHGIADNLALSIVAEMIGARQTVTVACALNSQLWAHPAVQSSVDTLRSWGVRVVEPVTDAAGLTMAHTKDVLATFLGATGVPYKPR